MPLIDRNAPLVVVEGPLEERKYILHKLFNLTGVEREGKRSFLRAAFVQNIVKSAFVVIFNCSLCLSVFLRGVFSR